MMLRVSDIFRLLVSDKATERRDGKKHLEEMIVHDRKTVQFSAPQYAELLRASMTFETKEIRANVRNKRPCDHNNALFFKSLCKHHRLFGEVSTTKVNELLKHLLNVLREDFISSNYKAVYLDILIEVALDCRYAQAITEESFLLLFEYISNEIPVLPTTNGTSNNLLPKLLRGFCRALFCDIVDSQFLEDILSWFKSIIEKVVGSKEEVKILNSIFDCCAILIDYHGTNHYTIFMKHIRSVDRLTSASC